MKQLLTGRFGRLEKADIVLPRGAPLQQRGDHNLVLSLRAEMPT